MIEKISSLNNYCNHVNVSTKSMIHLIKTHCLQFLSFLELTKRRVSYSDKYVFFVLIKKRMSSHTSQILIPSDPLFFTIVSM
jgi:hypothetical protein